VPHEAVGLCVDGRADQRQRADELGSLHGERRRDLAAHRVRDERRGLVQELAEPRAELGDGSRLTKHRAQELDPELPRERIEVPLPHTEPVHEDDHGPTVAIGSAAWHC
jgi:hypothetical protein